MEVIVLHVPPLVHLATFATLITPAILTEIYIFARIPQSVVSNRVPRSAAIAVLVALKSTASFVTRHLISTSENATQQITYRSVTSTSAVAA